MHDKAEEVTRSIASAARQVAKDNNGGRHKKLFTAEDIRQAARRFKKKTSIDTDEWDFAQITVRPEQILHMLADLISDMRHIAVPPLQAMNNIMAMLPTRDGE